MSFSNDVCSDTQHEQLAHLMVGRDIKHVRDIARRPHAIQAETCKLYPPSCLSHQMQAACKESVFGVSSAKIRSRTAELVNLLLHSAEDLDEARVASIHLGVLDEFHPLCAI